MKAGRLTALALVLCALVALAAPSAHADEAAQMYDPSTVYAIDLDLPQASLDELALHPTEEYVQGFLTLAPTAGTPGSEASPLIDEMEVGVRLKGSKGGSFRDLKDGKAAFKVKCNFISGKKCLGLKKLTLNNMVQDPSMLHETLSYSAFRAAGVPASRTGFAYVRVNGEDFGLYLNLETYDDVFLKRQFETFDDDVQHLYEGEVGDDVFPGGAALFEIDEGPDDRGDLEALVDAANDESGGPFSTRVAPHANLAEMTKMWAVEKYVDHWDGYAGHTDAEQAEKSERPNNYYLYSEPSGRFQMLPWGADQTWIPTIGVGTPGREVTFDGSGGVLFNKCLESEECFHFYWDALNLVTHTISSIEPATLAEDTADMLAPWQAKERADGRPDPNGDEVDEVEDAVEESLDFIAGRQAEAEEWLTDNEPASEEETTPEEGGSSGAAGSTPPLAPAAHSASTPHLERAARSGRRLTTKVRLSDPGQVTLRATFRLSKKQKQACGAGRRARAAGELTLGCKLSEAAMQTLARGSLHLTLTITLTLADGSKRVTKRKIRLS